MISDLEKKVYDVLKILNIEYTRYEHEPVYTIDEANKLDIDLPGHHCKNLFICDKKKKVFLLVIISDTKKLNLKELSSQTGYKGLTFASEENLLQHLGLTPGAVSPFGLINDSNKNVKVFLDSDIISNEYISFHPNVNNVTISMKIDDFMKFLKWCGNSIELINVNGTVNE